MLTLALALMLNVSPLPEGDKVTGFTVSVERVSLTESAGASVTTDPMLAEVILTGLKLSTKAPRLCPTSERRGERLVLHCTTRRVFAQLAHDERGAFLDVREVLGVSWLDFALVPLNAWSLRSLSLPDACPGKLAAARGECALAEGDVDAARAAWMEGLDGPDVSLCHLRLGDLAIREGAVEAALTHYAKIPDAGLVGRLAQLRSCELLGTCLTIEASDRAADTRLLAADLAREVRLLTVRRELAAGRDVRAMQVLLTALETDGDACTSALSLCQKFVAAGLESRELEARVAALSSFLTDKVRRGPAEYALNQAASRAASEIGAPGFAASILSANTPHVPGAELSSHLLGIIKLYVAARDPVRATVVLEYAEGKLGSVTRKGEWTSARRQLGRRAMVRPVPERSTEALDALSAQVSLSTDLARAASLRSKASTAEKAP
ncbi:MAG: hypothetical protein Q8N23_20220 [Archangium sp.]|nr:hypothetical protein [Archangium sp.]MDP3155016.1 hypothetical protein [Archangium sp.]MDP3574444.1 hypothetical protein [Archangium sp.]